MAVRPQKKNPVISILNTIRELNQLKDIDMILDRILFESRAIARADAGSIFLRRDDTLFFSHVQNDSLFGQRGAGAARYTNQSVSISEHSIVGYSALTKKAVIIDDAYRIDADLPYSFNSSFDKKTNYHTTSIFTIPLLTSNNSLVGVLQLINALDENGEVTVFSEYSRTYVPLLANHAAIAIEHGMLNRELILRMVKMAELHDPKETGAHVQRVSAFSAELYLRWAENRGLPAQEIKYYRDLISLAAMLHDSGKVGISDIILKKPGRLTEEEFDVIKMHTLYGAKLFTHMSSDLDKMTYEIALHHHEKWDGSGYPGRMESFEETCCSHPLSGEDIPLAARITALADVYDALSSRRCYKQAWDDEKVYEIIRSESGKHFDPELVQAFFEISDILKAIREKFS
jgi:HD-GYP domain-containing protein (c-di-GMP phosphodiesterase class II)